MYICYMCTLLIIINNFVIVIIILRDLHSEGKQNEIMMKEDTLEKGAPSPEIFTSTAESQPRSTPFSIYEYSIQC